MLLCFIHYLRYTKIVIHGIEYSIGIALGIFKYLIKRIIRVRITVCILMNYFIVIFTIYLAMQLKSSAVPSKTV